MLAFGRVFVARKPCPARLLCTARRAITHMSSNRIRRTDDPCIVQMQRMLQGTTDVLSLAQGVVHWKPPPEALDAAIRFMSTDPRAHSYCADDGLPELREALRHKLATENGLSDVDVMVTSGANQAFMNLVLAMLDHQSKAVLFKPYYFNHLMALQMTGAEVIFSDCDAQLVPDMAKLEAILAPGDVSMVVVCNPCNPTGVLTPKTTLQKCAELCAQYGASLVVDNTYDYFTYDGEVHDCVSGDHVVNLFSFSKAFGMMGHRVGYIAYPQGELKDSLLKVQDTVPICANIFGQIVALNALKAGGRDWVNANVRGLDKNRKLVHAALAPLGEDAVTPSSGAIYTWARLPAGCEDDKRVVERLVKEHGVCVIPGSAFGMPGHIRVAYANVDSDRCAAAAERLQTGLQQLLLAE